MLYRFDYDYVVDTASLRSSQQYWYGGVEGGKVKTNLKKFSTFTQGLDKLFVHVQRSQRFDMEAKISKKNRKCSKMQ